MKNLVGKRGTDYHGDPGTIVDQATVENYKFLSKYDDSGWMDDDSIKELGDIGLEPDDLLVAFKRDLDGGIDVYTFENGGVDLMEQVQGIPKAEEEIMNLLVEAHYKYIKLEPTHPSDMDEWVRSFHRLQGILGIRTLRRDYPAIYKSIRDES